MLVATLILPTTISLGIAFPLAMELAGGHDEHVAWRVGTVYSMNTIAAIGGALAAGFVAIPAWGLQGTLELVSVLLAADAAVVIARGSLPRRLQAAGLAAGGGCGCGPDRKPGVGPGGVGERRVSVRVGCAGRSWIWSPCSGQARCCITARGGASTVSVRELAGARSMAIDGKVDASTSGDMLTQKALAHLPLLLHPDPRDVLIIGLGSGVTLASALCPSNRARRCGGDFARGGEGVCVFCTREPRCAGRHAVAADSWGMDGRT